MRAARFNHVNPDAAARPGLAVARVPAYSPHAVAELILTLNRKIHRAHNRVREGNFTLDGLLLFELRGLTAGAIGAGKIGTVVARVLAGFGCRLLAHDPCPDPEVQRLGASYVPLVLTDSFLDRLGKTR